MTGFANRRARADSVTSFTYYPEEEISESSWPEDEAGEALEAEEEEEDLDAFDGAVNGDLESGLRSPSRRKSSGFSRISVEDPLLARSSSKLELQAWEGDRRSQKIYIVSEDLTVVFAGFKTSHIGYSLYVLLCCATAGLGYLLLRWMPRWRVRLIGSPCALRTCHWIVIEVQSAMPNWRLTTPDIV